MAASSMLSELVDRYTSYEKAVELYNSLRTMPKSSPLSNLLDGRISAEQREKILQTLAYHRTDYGLAAIRMDRFPSVNPIMRVFDRPSNNIPSLGFLDNLPVEIMHAIIRYLDIGSMINLGSVNTVARDLVSSLPELRQVRIHAENALQALLQLGCSSYFTILDLWSALTRKVCTVCKRFGAFLFIPTCSRCCHTCFCDSLELRPMLASLAQDCFGLSQKTLQKYTPILHALPGPYTMAQINCPGPERPRLVSLSAARKSAIGTYGKRNMWRRTAAWLCHPELIDGKSNDSRPKDPWGKDRKNWPARIKLPGNYWHRFMVVIQIPYLDHSNDRTEEGLSCKGCQIIMEMLEREAKSHEDIESITHRRMQSHRVNRHERK